MGTQKTRTRFLVNWTESHNDSSLISMATAKALTNLSVKRRISCRDVMGYYFTPLTFQVRDSNGKNITADR